MKEQILHLCTVKLICCIVPNFGLFHIQIESKRVCIDVQSLSVTPKGRFFSKDWCLKFKQEEPKTSMVIYRLIAKVSWIDRWGKKRELRRQREREREYIERRIRRQGSVAASKLGGSFWLGYHVSSWYIEEMFTTLQWRFFYLFSFFPNEKILYFYIRLYSKTTELPWKIITQ